MVEAGPGPADPRPGAPSAPFLPRHCELFGKLQEHAGANGQTYAIRFHMRLPAAWNERFFFQGGGGSNGVIGSATGNLMGAQSQTALGLGYAVVSQDSGHDNALNNDPKLQGTATFGWDPEARRNYGFASIGAVTVAAKAVIRSFYGRTPVYSYFVGGSKGGQEAFMASQRFGREFDGVLAGYPGFRLATAGSAGEMWDDQAFATVARQAGAVGSDGQPLLNRSFSDADLALVSQAVLEACDALDGLKDGMVFDFARCTTSRVKPMLARMSCKDAKTACLTAAQVAALIRVYDGARDRTGKLLYATWPWDAGVGGLAPGGYFDGWRAWKIGDYTAPLNNARNMTLAVATVSAVFTSPPTPVAADPMSQTRYALGLDITASEAASRVKWGPHNESSVDFMNAVATDLAPFTSHGGKLLIYHGVSDPVFSINDTIAWLNAVNRFEKGKASRFVRLFAVPGMNHGGGGPATDQADFFSALVNWTEHGTAPDNFVATARSGTNWPGRTRLLCAYPKVGRYVSGDAEKASSFACR
jgi:feruloyl esterase